MSFSQDDDLNKIYYITKYLKKFINFLTPITILIHSSIIKRV